MTTHRDKGVVTFECDGCSSALTVTNDDWDEVMDKFRDKGWKAEKVDGQWLHLCEDCKNKP